MRANGVANITTGTRTAIVNELRRGEKCPNIARRFHVSETTVYAIAKAEGIKVRRWRRWTREEDELIRFYYPIYGGEWDGWEKLMPKRMPTAGDIYVRANKLGVHPA